MNRNITATILIVISVAIYVTMTKDKIAEVQAVQADNTEYTTALANSDKLISVRDKVLKEYNDISAENRTKLEKMVPNTVDNIRLIIDLKNKASEFNISLKNIKANVNTNDKSTNVTNRIQSNTTSGAIRAEDVIPAPTLDTVTVSFGVTTTYQQFIDFMRALESNMRIMDLTKLTVTANDTGTYDFGVELRTYWLRQK